MTTSSIRTLESFNQQKYMKALIIDKQGYNGTAGSCRIGKVEADDAEEMSRGGWGAGLLPIAVGVCPTDEAAVKGNFPTGVGKLKDRKGVILGHEGVSQLVSWDEETREILQAKGLRLGDIVVADINVGCGFCRNCKQGKPGIYCESGPVFVGVGASPEADNSGWPIKKTGKRHPGGYYREGVVYMPARSVHKVPLDNVEKPEDLFIFSQADGVACVKVIIDESGIPRFNDKYGTKAKPRIFILGAGRLGTQAGLLLQDLGLSNGVEIMLVDNNVDNLGRARDLLGIEEDHCYLVDDDDKDSLSRDAWISNVPALKSAEKGEGLADVVIDTAGHGVVPAEKINQMFEQRVLGKGSRFVTASHTGIPNQSGSTGVVVGDAGMSMNNQLLVTVLSPQDKMAEAIDYLGKNIKLWRKNITVLSGGLDLKGKAKDGTSYVLGDVVGGLVPGIKSKMEGTTFIVPVIPSKKAESILKLAKSNA